MKRLYNNIIKTIFTFFIAAFFVCILPLSGWGQNTSNFNDGYLTVFKNTSASALGSTGTAIVLEEYLPSTTSQSSPNYSVAIPFASSAGSNGIVCGATTSSNGAISRSENGRYILVPGWSTNSSISGSTAIGSANTTFTICAIRPVNGSGTINTGITGTSNWFTTANDYRGATSDDLTNYWVTGGSVGLKTTTNGTSLTTVSTTSTNTRSVNIFNGQLYYSTGSGTQGVYQVGTGKSISASTTSVILASPSTGAYGFAVSPDFLTIYTNSATGVISRWTYSGTYSSGAYSGGSWSSASTGLSLSGVTGVAVDWSGYSFSTSANGAIIYACNTTTLVKANDNGTGSMTASTLRTISGNNIFKQLAFSPIKQTVSIGSSTPAVGNITKGGTSVPLFQFNLSADEGNSTIKKVTIAKTGTATISTSGATDIANFHLINDANNNGVFDGGETDYGQGTVSGSNIAFSVSFGTYITQGSSANFLVVADIASGATSSNTITLNISSNKTINSTNYTTNIVNAGSSPVYMGTSVPTGNQLTIAAPASTTATISNGGTPASANLGINVTDKLVFGFSITPAGGNIDFNAVNITTSGTAGNNDINNFRLYYDADTSGTVNGGDVLLQTISSLTNPLNFNSISGQTAFSSIRKYLLIADMPNSATSGNIFAASIASASDVTTTATSSSGTAVGNNQYIGNPSSNIDNTGNPSASNMAKSSTNFVVLGFKLNPIGMVNFSTVSITTGGTAGSSDISNFRLYYDVNTNGVFDNGTDVLLSTVASLSGTLSFSSFASAQTNLTSSRNYILIADISSSSVTNNTFTASIATASDITLASGSNTGTVSGNTMTIDAGTYNDFKSNGTGGGNWSAYATWLSYSATGTWVSASAAPTTSSYAGNNVTIKSGDIVVADGTASQYSKDLTIESSAKLYANGGTSKFVNVYGNLTCNGTIGNGTTYDGIGFDIEGSSCTISGSGTFDAARIAKNSVTSPASTTTNLIFDMNVNLRYGGTAGGSQSSNNTELYVNIAGAILNITINTNRTVACIGDGTATAAAALSIDGVDGTGSGERGGAIIVNGTLDIQQNGTGVSTLFLKTNNTTSPVSFTIGSTGTVNTPKLDCAASAAAGHSFVVNNGGILNINNEPTSFVTPITTNNTYTFSSGSIIQYSKSGNQTIYSFGSTSFDNFTLSGSGIKTSPSSITVNGTLALGNNTLNIAGNTLSINGDFTTGTGVIKSNGSAIINIGGTGALTNSLLFDQTTPGTTNRVQNFNLNRGTSTSTGSITLGNTLEITGTLSLSNGTFNTGGTLTLVSNASGTARVASIPSTADILGNVKSQRYVPAVVRQYRMISPNTSSFTYSDLIDNIFVSGTGGSTNGFDNTTSNGNTIYTYQESTSGIGRGWKGITAITNSLSPANGAIIFVRGDRTLTSPDWYTQNNSTYPSSGGFPAQNAVTIDFNGALNKGSYSPTITYTSSGITTDDGWNLIGNPYPCQINWSALTSTNVDTYYYIFNPSTGSYVSDNGVNYIASGQAFFIQTTGSSPSITLTENAKVSSAPISYFKSASAPSIELRMTKDSFNSDIAFISFNSSSSKGFVRGEDALKFTNSKINLGFYIDSNTLLQRSSVPMPSITDTFAMIANAAVGTYTLAVSNINNALPLSKNIYLHDLFNNNFIDLRASPTYTFTITSNPSSSGKRFELIFIDPSMLPVSLISFTGQKNASSSVKLQWQTANEKNNIHFVVQRSTDNSTFEDISLINGNGTTSSAQSYQYIDASIPQNTNILFYKLKQVDLDGQINYSKTVVVNFVEIENSLTIYPNPANEMLFFKNTSEFKDYLSIDVYNILGKQCFSNDIFVKKNEEIAINISSLEAGIYTVIIKEQLTGKQLKSKFIKN